ncbi:MAG TPA: hypothetical protein VJH37_00820, partial [Candidatus Nanoarchaeia archaeon]|nr:hypothetical protein [Candidatus Nanoarchaeia archaeon]
SKQPLRRYLLPQQFRIRQNIAALKRLNIPRGISLVNKRNPLLTMAVYKERYLYKYPSFAFSIQYKQMGDDFLGKYQA